MVVVLPRVTAPALSKVNEIESKAIIHSINSELGKRNYLYKTEQSDVSSCIAPVFKPPRFKVRIYQT
jgi:hypothetical protein